MRFGWAGAFVSFLTTLLMSCEGGETSLLQEVIARSALIATAEAKPLRMVRLPFMRVPFMVPVRSRIGGDGTTVRLPERRLTRVDRS